MILLGTLALSLPGNESIIFNSMYIADGKYGYDTNGQREV